MQYKKISYQPAPVPAVPWGQSTLTVTPYVGLPPGATPSIVVAPIRRKGVYGPVDTWLDQAIRYSTRKQASRPTMSSRGSPRVSGGRTMRSPYRYYFSAALPMVSGIGRWIVANPGKSYLMYEALSRLFAARATSEGGANLSQGGSMLTLLPELQPILSLSPEERAAVFECVRRKAEEVIKARSAGVFPDMIEAHPWVEATDNRFILDPRMDEALAALNGYKGGFSSDEVVAQFSDEKVSEQLKGALTEKLKTTVAKSALGALGGAKLVPFIGPAVAIFGFLKNRSAKKKAKAAQGRMGELQHYLALLDDGGSLSIGQYRLFRRLVAEFPSVDPHLPEHLKQTPTNAADYVRWIADNDPRIVGHPLAANWLETKKRRIANGATPMNSPGLQNPVAPGRAAPIFQSFPLRGQMMEYRADLDPMANWRFSVAGVDKGVPQILIPAPKPIETATVVLAKPASFETSFVEVGPKGLASGVISSSANVERIADIIIEEYLKHVTSFGPTNTGPSIVGAASSYQPVLSDAPYYRSVGQANGSSTTARPCRCSSEPFASDVVAQEGEFYRSNLFKARLVPMRSGLYGQINLRSAPFVIDINSRVVKDRTRVAMIHEFMHGLNELLKLGMNHEQLHLFSVYLFSEVIPAYMSLEERLINK